MKLRLSRSFSRREFLETALIGSVLLVLPGEAILPITKLREKFRQMEEFDIVPMVPWCDPDVKTLLKTLSSFDRIPFFGLREEDQFNSMLSWIGKTGPLVPEHLDLLEQKIGQTLKN